MIYLRESHEIIQQSTNQSLNQNLGRTIIFIIADIWGVHKPMIFFQNLALSKLCKDSATYDHHS